MSQNNSRKITILRTNNFVQAAQDTQAVADFMAMSQKNIGPYLESNTSGIIGSGLTHEEKRLLMPYIISIEPDDREFRKAVDKWFNHINTKIPFNNGKDFEIGLSKDNNKPVSKDNLPLNVEHYVRYRHAKSHPWVGASQEEAKGNSLKYFYIYDAEAQVEEDNKKVVLQDKADGIWLSIKSQPQKISMLLTLLGEDERDYHGRNSEIRKQNKLRELLSKDPASFLDVYENQRFETLYWLKAMEKAKVVEKVGEGYVIRETKEKLGFTELQTLLFLENVEENGDKITYLKSTTQDIMRKPRISKQQKQ